MSCTGLNDEEGGREGEKQRNNPWLGFILLNVVVCGS